MQDLSSSRVTELLSKWKDGDQQALHDLLPIVYPQLRQLAQGGGILGIFADRQTDAPAFLAPLQVVGPFGMALGSAVYEDGVGTDSAA